MAELTSIFDLNREVETYSPKIGYAHGIQYYFAFVKGNSAVRQSEYREIIKKFDEALKDLLKLESSTALVDMDNYFNDIFKGGDMPEVFVNEGLRPAMDCISECIMNLKKLYNLDYYM